MSEVLPVQIIPPTFPEGYCPSSLQELFNDYSAGARLSSPLTLDSVIIAETAPADHTKLWFKFSGTVADPYNLYWWSTDYGAWVSNACLDPSGIVKLWEGSLTDLATYDGGDTNPPGAISGPMWEQATEYNDNGIIGVGTLAATVGASVGATSYALTNNNIPLHNFWCFNSTVQGGGSPFANATDSVSWNGGGLGNENYVTLSVPSAGHNATLGPTNDYGKNPPDPVPTITPSIGIYFIRRTARLYRLG